MSEDYYKEKLYPLQDAVLDAVKSVHSVFYLTGGTFLSRFLMHHRYSDDLDFFTNASPDFDKSLSEVINVVSSRFSNVELSSKYEAYVRYFVTEGGVQLKLEFVNDVKYRTGSPNRIDNLMVDTWENVLSNKLTAIMTRDEPKDFTDILFLNLNCSFNWERIMDEAKRKDANVNEIEVSQRLLNFDCKTLSKVIFPSFFDVSKISTDHFKTLARESLHGFDNSLFGQKL